MDTRVCGPAACPLRKGEDVCKTEIKAVRQRNARIVLYHRINKISVSCTLCSTSKTLHMRCAIWYVRFLLLRFAARVSMVSSFTQVPQKVCHEATKLVPRLVPRRKCVDEPSEFCFRMRVNPRRVRVRV